MEISDPESQFVESAKLHGLTTNGGGDPEVTNAAYDKAIAAVKMLRKRPDRGQTFFLACLRSDNPSVVTAAALNLLPDREADAIKALKRVARGGDLIAFDAEMVLREWKAGNLQVE